MAPDICIYHGNCADGFAAAWCVWKRWGDNVVFVPGTYGVSPPGMIGKHVLMVDFSYKRPVLEAIASEAASVTILDHHKTAQADLAPFAVPHIWDLLAPEDLAEQPSELGKEHPPIQAYFDMDHSGAALAWSYCFRPDPLPRLIGYVEDRDLWRFELEGSREIAAYLFSHPYDFKTWDDIAHMLQSVGGFGRARSDGEAIERKHFKDIHELLGLATRTMVIGGRTVKVANLPYTMASDAANMLAEDAPFGACYFDRADGQRVFSLRSQASGLDVAEIAASYGGGGHARAAGFQAPLGWEGDEDYSVRQHCADE